MLKLSRRAGVLLSVALWGVASPALAASELVVTYSPETQGVTRQLPVEVADLQLSTREGRAQLEQRVIHAAKAVCDYNGLYGIRQSRDYDRCYARAKEDALNQAMLVKTAAR